EPDGFHAPAVVGSSRLGVSSLVRRLTPVRLPPAGRDWRPGPTGSLAPVKAIWIVEVALFPASAGSSPAGNRHALVVDTRLTLATGTAEREAALEMVAARPGITLGADKASDVAPFPAADI